MRCNCALLLTLLSGQLLCGQVAMDVPIRTSGSTNERAIDGLEEPASATSAVNVRASVVHGGFTWCNVITITDTIELAPEPAVTELNNGLLLRFLANANAHGDIYIKCVSNLPAIPLKRPDGAKPAVGQIEAGTVCEIIFANGVFTLMNASGANCPQGFLAATERLCVEVQPVPTMLFHPARDRCAALGGKLCTWSEFVVGCNVLGSQLQGLFTDWEWIDDTSNHAHTTDRAGRFTCGSMSNTGLFDTVTSNSRCCFHPR